MWRDGRLCYTEASVAACPNQCIRYCGEEIDSEAVVAKLQKNIPLLNQSGGGVTFSGGEPLYQIDFLVDCLARLAGKTHRMIQTSGFAPRDDFARVLPHLEGALYDLKLFDSETHRRYTGVPNDLILQNYRTLAASGLPFTTRIPLIPTVTDTEENLFAICRFMRENSVSYAELMPYHSMTGSKYPLCGKTYAPSFDDTQAPQSHPEIFADYGIQIKVL
jgi:pyruvate formate lyase activating enzyme